MNIFKVTSRQVILFAFAFFLSLITYHLSASSLFATSEFSTSYDVSYDVSLDGVTTVTEKVILKNLTSKYYATSFSLTIGSTQIFDVSASDEGGALEVAQEQKGTSTTLGIKFNQQVAGEGKTLPWTLKFKSKDFATQVGKVWEVSVPKVSVAENLESYNLNLSVPVSFGEPTQISPRPKSQSKAANKLFLNFDKDQLTNSGVSASFGSFQLFDFDLLYHLENPNLFPIITNIALPPDTAYQDIIFSKVEPKPVNVTVDDDGNYLAWYNLKRGEKVDIKVQGSSKLYSSSKAKSPSLSEALRKKYTSAEKYWEKDHPAIKTKLSEILGRSAPGDSSEKAKLIHRFVSGNLGYDSGRLSSNQIERLGAVTALNNPKSAVCMEFTDLFIALARAGGIPARELNGFAYSANPTLRPLSLTRDILHAWPEYWDPEKGWVMVDPTWENTTGGVDYFNKLDLNHFVFVIKGLSSQTPVPAGSYKYIGVNSKDVKVEFGKDDFLGKHKLWVEVFPKEELISGFPNKLKLRIENQGNALFQSSSLGITSGELTILGSGISETGPIPSLGFAQFSYDVRTKSLLSSYDDIVEVSIADQKYRQEVSIRPFFIFRYFPWILIGLIGGVALIYLTILSTLVYRRRFLQRTKPKKT